MLCTCGQFERDLSDFFVVNVAPNCNDALFLYDILISSGLTTAQENVMDLSHVKIKCFFFIFYF